MGWWKKCKAHTTWPWVGHFPASSLTYPWDTGGIVKNSSALETLPYKLPDSFSVLLWSGLPSLPRFPAAKYQRIWFQLERNRSEYDQYTWSNISYYSEHRSCKTASSYEFFPFIQLFFCSALYSIILLRKLGSERYMVFIIVCTSKVILGTYFVQVYALYKWYKLETV